MQNFIRQEMGEKLALPNPIISTQFLMEIRREPEKIIHRFHKLGKH
jgi:hypothetical protein